MQILIPDYLKNKRLRRGDLGSVEQDEFCDIIISCHSGWRSNSPLKYLTANL